jgi:type II secretory pathway pseudopilin PulG
LVEVVIVLVLVAIMLALVLARFETTRAIQGLRYGVQELAGSLREAQERAKAERTGYTVTITAGSSDYFLARSAGGFRQDETLPQRAVPTASATITFSAFGVPDAPVTITLQNSAGTATVAVNAMGGITTAAP